MPLRPPISFNCETIWNGAEPLAVDAHGHARLEADGHLLALVGGLLRRDGHAEVDQLHAVDVQVFQLAGLVADVQAVLVRAVGLGRGRLDGDISLVAIGDHLAAAGEELAELLDPPGGDDADRRAEGLGGQLEAALVVALARGTVGVGVGPHLAGDLQADLRDQRPGDRRAQEIDAFIFCLPLQDGKGEIAAEFLLGVDDPGRAGPDLAGLLQNGLAVFAGLPQIDVDGVDIVALFHEPAENDRGIQSARIGQYTGRHENLFVAGSNRENPILNRAGAKGKGTFWPGFPQRCQANGYRW